MTRRSRGAAALAAFAIAIGTLLTGAGAAAAQTDSCRVDGKGDPVQWLRYPGSDRYQTAMCVSATTWADHGADEKPEFKAAAVVLARGDEFPDALAGGPLAAHLGAPLLLTTPTTLRPEVRLELQRVLATGRTVYLLGGTGSLSAGVESQVRALGYQTKRLAGANRFDTAIKVAEELPATSKFFVTTGMDFPDALAAGNAAAMLNRGGETWALMFTNNGTMPAATSAFIRQRRAQFGGQGSLVTTGLADRAAASAFGAANLTHRFVGRNRYETATLIAAEYFVAEDGSLIGEGVGLSAGNTFPDALAGTAKLALYGEPLLLTGPSLPAETRQFLQGVAGKVPGEDGDPATATVDVFGGTGVVSDAVTQAAVRALAPAS
ncbi:cell wall-binding repeat-containing protein [Actinokineospora guangxiensis]|uniref:Cell wall-binding repeat-containing protein n=1 Tax=Actinokineospora guangxiensis TaxID=1490288 RepID=A0ABW0EX46_9PSEU